MSGDPILLSQGQKNRKVGGDHMAPVSILTTLRILRSLSNWLVVPRGPDKRCWSSSAWRSRRKETESPTGKRG